MIKKNYFFTLLLFITLSCSYNENLDIKNVVYKNTDSMNKKDIEGYMSTIYPEDTLKFNSTRRTMLYVFNSVELTARIDSFSILNKWNDSVKVLTVMSFKLNDQKEKKSKMTHILVKYKGSWYISSSQVIE